MLAPLSLGQPFLECVIEPWLITPFCHSMHSAQTVSRRFTFVTCSFGGLGRRIEPERDVRAPVGRTDAQVVYPAVWPRRRVFVGPPCSC